MTTEMYRFRQYVIRPDMLDSIKLYIEKHVPVGGFLQAVICNDLKEAIGRADDINMDNLPAFVAYFYNEAPHNCWGSKEAYEKWINLSA